MKVRELITKLNKVKNKDVKVILTFVEEDEDIISTSYFDFVDKEDYIELISDEDTQL